MAVFVSARFVGRTRHYSHVSLVRTKGILTDNAPRRLIRGHKTTDLRRTFVTCLRRTTKRDGRTRTPPIMRSAARTPHRKFDLHHLFDCDHHRTLRLQHSPMHSALTLVKAIVLVLVVNCNVDVSIRGLHFTILSHSRAIDDRT